MQLKRLSDLFWKISPNLYFLSLVLGVVTGLCYSLLVPFLMYSINARVDDAVSNATHGFSFFDSPTSTLGMLFLVTCASIVIIKTVSTTLSMYVANRASVEHRLWLYRRIQHLKLADLERIGQARLFNVLNIDIPAVTAAAVNLPQIWISCVTVLGVLGYLVHLNFRVFGFVVMCILIAVITNQLPLIFAQRLFRRSRESYDRVQQGVTGLILGAKELKLNRIKADAFYQNDLLGPEHTALGDNLKGHSLVILLACYGDILSFLIVSIVVFHFRYTFSLTPAELLGLSMALLYLAGPVSTVLNVMGGVQHGKTSLRKLQGLYAELVDEAVVEAEPLPNGWDQIVVRDLCYAYGDGPNGFAVQNVNLQFPRGAVSFIIGGNGSGKSTLGKCLSFLYFPTSGHIAIGDTVVNRDNVEAARQCVSAIFPDFYLFKKLYAGCDADTQAMIKTYLGYLQLEHKVVVVDDEFSTIELSEGQRKRLALLVTLMENRDICVFDEWAADQDPAFKEIFYSIILQDMKRKNRVVIVISHDDRYFNYADQIITMESGKVVASRSNQQYARMAVNS